MGVWEALHSDKRKKNTEASPWEESSLQSITEGRGGWLSSQTRSCSWDTWSLVLGRHKEGLWHQRSSPRTQSLRYAPLHLNPVFLWTDAPSLHVCILWQQEWLDRWRQHFEDSRLLLVSFSKTTLTSVLSFYFFLFKSTFCKGVKWCAIIDFFWNASKKEESFQLLPFDLGIITRGKFII